MARRNAAYTLALLVGWGTLTRLLVLFHGPARHLADWIHFGLGTGYELAAGCGAAALVYLASLARPALGRGVAWLWVTALLLLNYIDYCFLREFYTHLPYSAVEYLRQAKDFVSSVAGVVFTGGFVGLLLVPVALATWLFLLRPAPVPTRRQGWPGHAAHVMGLLLVGLAFNTVSNSYVSKNLEDPLQFTPLQHLLFTRNAEHVALIPLPVAAVQRLGAPEQEYPLLREMRFAGCERPAPAFQELCQGARALGGRPNLVFIMLESFRAQELGALGGHAGISPHFDALAQRGVLFDRFFGNGFQTRDGAAASYCSQLPNPAGPVMTVFGKDRERCLPQVLREQGYHTAWVHNGDAEFDGQREFLLRNGFQQVVDRWDYPLGTPSAGWGLVDEALMQKAVQVLDATPQPFFVALESMTNHHPFEAPEGWRTHSGQGEYSRFLDTMAYTDFAVGKFFELAKGRPWAPRTVYFLYADHSVQQPADGPLNTLDQDMTWRHRIPLLILADWLHHGTRVPWPSSQVDLPPLALDLLGYQGQLPWLGHSPMAGPETLPTLLVRGTDYVGLVLPGGAVAVDGVRGWQVQGEVPPELRQWSSDLLLASRWALQENHLVPPPAPLVGQRSSLGAPSAQAAPGTAPAQSAKAGQP